MVAAKVMDAQSALEQFIVDNRKLEQLEDLLVDFNIFEVLGIEKSETRHSLFLAWLLDPSGNHGLGDYFLRRFLLLVTSYARSHEMAEITAFDVDHWKLREVNVETERHRIDVLLTSPEDRFVCAIENKLFSGEHGNQLERYRHVVKREYDGLTPLYVFLTIDGQLPTKESDAAHYVPISHHQISDLVQQVLDSRSTNLGTNLQATLAQYVTSLRRHVLVDSDIQQLARQIYYDHKEAIELIIGAIPDVQLEIRDIVEAELRNYPQFKVDPVSWSQMFRTKNLSDTARINGTKRQNCSKVKDGRILTECCCSSSVTKIL